MKKQTLYWLVPQVTPRISYLASALFGNWKEATVVPVANRPSDDNCVLNSTIEPHPNQIQLPLISTVLLECQQTSCLPKSLPNLVVATPDSVDWLGIAFWLLSEYVNYTQPTFDKFDRYDFQAIWHTSFYQKPFIDLFVNDLSQKITQKWPAINLSQPDFNLELSCDIDHLFAFREKGFGHILKKVALSLYRKDLNLLKLVGNYLLRNQDPFEKPWELLLKIPPEQLRFFVLLSNEHIRDSFYSSEYQGLTQKILQLSALQYPVGIHPSYLAIEKPGTTERQHQMLKKITHSEVRSSRQHYLRYRLPATYRELISLGITEEYTSCLPQIAGYKYGTCRPFYWYDIQNEKVTNLKIFPTVVMDRTLLEDMALSPEQAHQLLAQLKTDIQGVGGDFRILIHPETLSNTFEWRGWLRVFTRLLSL